MSGLLKCSGKLCLKNGFLLPCNRRYNHSNHQVYLHHHSLNFRHQRQLQALMRHYLDVRGQLQDNCLAPGSSRDLHTCCPSQKYSITRTKTCRSIHDALESPFPWLTPINNGVNGASGLHMYDGGCRRFHISGHLFEQPSSKVEVTVQTIKNKQKEKVEEIMKEAAAAASGSSTTSTKPGAGGGSTAGQQILGSKSGMKTGAAESSSTGASTTATSRLEMNTGVTGTGTGTGTGTASSTHVMGGTGTGMSSAESISVGSSSTTTTTTSTMENKATTATTATTTVARKSLKTRIWEEMLHYYHGFRLLMIDINICRKLLWRVLQGKTLTRRENRLLVRTTSDLFRLIPFSVFIIVPFMELLLPVFIKLFPGLLPSTFQTAKEREDKLKQAVQVRLEMVKFLQKTLDEMAVHHKEHKSEDAKQFSLFFQRIKNPNEYVSTEEIIKFAKRFEDEITLDSLSRQQLMALCRVLDLNTVGTTSFLRFQLRLKLRSLAADDRVIAREGVNSLDMWEVQQACKARGMRAYGLTEERMRNQLQEWIDLSLNEKVPQTLILLSRTMLISDDAITSDKLKETMRVLPDSLATQTKAAIGEREGKIDNKTQIEIIKEEERKIKEEREEEREIEEADKLRKGEQPVQVKAKQQKEMETELQFAEKLVESKEEAAISSKDMDLLNQALKTLSTDKEMVVEKETIKDLKEELEEYKEDVQELREVGRAVQEPVDESKAAKLLFNKVNRMIGQLDKVLDDLEQKRKQRGEGKVGVESAPQPKPVSEDLVHINDLIETINKIRNTTDESRLGHIVNVLSKLDTDNDGVITIEEVRKVVDTISRDNVHLNAKQLEELIELLEKEQNLEAVGKIEKALAKSQKEVDEAKKLAALKVRTAESTGEKTTCTTCLEDTAKILEDHAKDMDKCDTATKVINVDDKDKFKQEGVILEAIDRQKEKVLPSKTTVTPSNITSSISSAVPPPASPSPKTTHAAPPLPKASQMNSEDKML